MLMSLDELIKAANQLDETDLDRLLQQVVTMRTQRKAHVLSSKETQLLDRINRGVPTDLRAQYQKLRAKFEAETLTEDEHNTLIWIGEQIEQLSAERLEALVELSQLRQVSLTELMNQLGIEPASNA